MSMHVCEASAVPYEAIIRVKVAAPAIRDTCPCAHLHPCTVSERTHAFVDVRLKSLRLTPGEKDRLLEAIRLKSQNLFGVAADLPRPHSLVQE